MNFDMVKKLVAYCREQEKIHNKNFRFTMTTNGVLIDDDVIDFCNKECHNVVLSLDGRKEVNDRFRVDCAGNGSYDRIVPKFQEFVKKRGDKSYYMRGTYTHYNTDFTNDIFHMADLGFTELSMEPVVSKPTDPSALTAEDLPILKEQYEILAKEMIKRDREGRGFTFYHYMIDLTGGPCIYKRISGCGSGGFQRGHILEALAQVGLGDVGAGAVLGQQSGHDLVGRVLFVHRNGVVGHVVHDVHRAAAGVQHDVISVQLILVYHFILQSIVAIKKCRPAKAA